MFWLLQAPCQEQRQMGPKKAQSRPFTEISNLISTFFWGKYSLYILPEREDLDKVFNLWRHPPTPHRIEYKE